MMKIYRFKTINNNWEVDILSDKGDKIKGKIQEFVESAVDLAESQGKLDYISIIISNHNGNLQMDHQIRDRTKAY